MKDQLNKSHTQKYSLNLSDTRLSSLEIATLIPLPLLPQGIDELLALSSDAVFLTNTSGLIVAANDQFTTLFGSSTSELLATPWESLLVKHLSLTPLERPNRRSDSLLTRSSANQCDLFARRKDGSEFPVEMNLRPLMVDGQLWMLVTVHDLTPQKIDEQEYKQFIATLQLQNKLLTLAHDAILICRPHGQVVFWNRGAENLYGWSAASALGQHQETLLQTISSQSYAAIEETLAEHDAWEGDLLHTCRDGKQVLVESRWELVRDDTGQPQAILEINRDATRRRALECQERARSAQVTDRLLLFQNILDQLPNAIFLLRGPQSRLLLANQAAIDLWGKVWPFDLPAKDFLKQSGIRFFTENGLAISFTNLASAQVMATGKAHFQRQVVLRRPDGAAIPIIVDVLPLPAYQPCAADPVTLDPPERLVLVAHQDVTAFKENEMLKDQFVSLATHELRNPVTIMAGYADLLLKRATQGGEHTLDEWQKTRLLEIKRATQQLATLTEDLLDTTRVQSSQLQLNIARLDLVGLTTRTIERLQTTTTTHTLSLTTDLSELWVLTDELRIEQVLNNLLNNAIKYSPAGGSIVVNHWKDTTKHQACFSLSDQGLGIPQEQQAQIFGRFMRASNARSTGIRGNGLGLYLCRELLERLGGHICFKSTEGKGTTFFFWLPLPPEEAASPL